MQAACAALGPCKSVLNDTSVCLQAPYICSLGEPGLQVLKQSSVVIPNFLDSLGTQWTDEI